MFQIRGLTAVRRTQPFSIGQHFFQQSYPIAAMITWHTTTIINLVIVCSMGHTGVPTLVAVVIVTPEYLNIVLYVLITHAI